MLQQPLAKSHSSAHAWFQAKLGCLLVLLVGDLLFNSSAEYDDFAATLGADDTEPQLIAVMILGLQLLLQVAILLMLFVMMFDTWPFRAGLMGLLADQFKWVCAASAAYMVATALLYGYRLSTLFSAVAEGQSADTVKEAWQVWDSRAYTAFSVMHKLGASVYYVANLRAGLRLGEPMFYTKDAWIAMFNQQSARDSGSGSSYSSSSSSSAALYARVPSSSDDAAVY